MASHEVKIEVCDLQELTYTAEERLLRATRQLHEKSFAEDTEGLLGEMVALLEAIEDARGVLQDYHATAKRR